MIDIFSSSGLSVHSVAVSDVCFTVSPAMPLSSYYCVVFERFVLLDLNYLFMCGAYSALLA